MYVLTVDLKCDWLVDYILTCKVTFDCFPDSLLTNKDVCVQHVLRCLFFRHELDGYWMGWSCSSCRNGQVLLTLKIGLSLALHYDRHTVLGCKFPNFGLRLNSVKLHLTHRVKMLVVRRTELAF